MRYSNCIAAKLPNLKKLNTLWTRDFILMKWRNERETGLNIELYFLLHPNWNTVQSLKYYIKSHVLKYSITMQLDALFL